jgi:hypothetical protein
MLTRKREARLGQDISSKLCAIVRILSSSHRGSGLQKVGVGRKDRPCAHMQYICAPGSPDVKYQGWSSPEEIGPCASAFLRRSEPSATSSD